MKTILSFLFGFALLLRSIGGLACDNLALAHVDEKRSLAQVPAGYDITTDFAEQYAAYGCLKVDDTKGSGHRIVVNLRRIGVRAEKATVEVRRTGSSGTPVVLRILAGAVFPFGGAIASAAGKAGAFSEEATERREVTVAIEDYSLEVEIFAPQGERVSYFREAMSISHNPLGSTVVSRQTDSAKALHLLVQRSAKEAGQQFERIRSAALGQ